MKRKFVAFLVFLLPPVRLKTILLRAFGWKLEKNVRIGHSWIEIKHIHAKEHVKIGHLNYINIDYILMQGEAKLGHLNTVYGPFGVMLRERAEIGNRNQIKRAKRPIVWGHSALVLGELSKITSNHVVDCTRPVIFGDFTTLAGIGSQIWTHGYLHAPAGPERFRIDGFIDVGDNVYIGSSCVLNAGVSVGDGITIGAQCCVSSSLEKPGLYVGQGLRWLPLDFYERLMRGNSPNVENLSEKVIVKNNMTNTHGSHVKLTRGMMQAGLFFLGKSSVLLAPLFAAYIWSPGDYGRLEWWISTATLLGSAIALGAPAVISFEIIANKKELAGAATLHVITASTVVTVVILGLLFIVGFENASWLIAVLLAAQVALQLTLTGELRAAGLGGLGSVGQSALYILIFGFLGLHYAGMSIVSAITLLSCLTQIALIWFIFRRSRIRWVQSSRSWLNFLSYGPRVMLAAFLFMLINQIPRVYLGSTASGDELAKFALVYRWLAIAIVAHQFFGTVFFRFLFDPDKKAQDLRLSIPVAGVGLASTVIVIFLYFVPADLNLPLPLPGDRAKSFMFLVAAVLPFWSAVATMEGIFYREKKPFRLIGGLASGFVFGVIYLFVTIQQSWSGSTNGLGCRMAGCIVSDGLPTMCHAQENGSGVA